MKRLLLIMTAFMLAFAAVASAQTGPRIELFADAQGSECDLRATGGRDVQVHMILLGASGVGAVQFKAPKPDCWTNATWVGDDLPWTLFIGDTQANDPRGLSIAFLSDVACTASNSPIYLGSIHYALQGPSPVCCRYPVLKAPDLHPEFDGPIGTLCLYDHQLFGIEGGVLMINPDESCGCIDQAVLPVRYTNWGTVKALYN